MASRKTDSTALYAFDEELRTQHGILCGVDEAGRGPLCGPVCCTAVILDPANPVEGVNDSKKLSAKHREELYEEITRKALAWKVIFVPPEEIDEKNILWATMDGMAQAVAGLDPAPAYVLVDGNRYPPDVSQPGETVVKGDANSASIAAASILAKVSRDRYVSTELDAAYPQYQFAKHKGYGTKLHYTMLDQYGPCPAHRKTFLKKWEARRP